MTTTKKRWTASEARKVLAEWQQSGESMAAFARRQGLVVQRLKWWQRRLAKAAPPVELVPMVMRPARAASALRVQLEGCEVEVAELTSESAAWLAALARALREAR